MDLGLDQANTSVSLLVIVVTLNRLVRSRSREMCGETDVTHGSGWSPVVKLERSKYRSELKSCLSCCSVLKANLGVGEFEPISF